jgi:hypothetical protein
MPFFLAVLRENDGRWEGCSYADLRDTPPRTICKTKKCMVIKRLNWRMTVLNVITMTFLLSTSLIEKSRQFRQTTLRTDRRSIHVQSIQTLDSDTGFGIRF